MSQNIYFSYRLVLPLFFLTFGAMGCSVCDWVSSPPLTQSPELIWNTAYKVIDSRYNILRASSQDKEIETDWRVHVSPHYLEGYRLKVYARVAEYEKPKERPGEGPINLNEEEADEQNPVPKFVVKICVIREQNRDLDDPGMPGIASWFPSGNDLNEAKLLIGFIQSRLALYYLPEKKKKSKPVEPRPGEIGRAHV